MKIILVKKNRKLKISTVINMSLYTINKYFGLSVFKSEDTDKHIIFKPSYGIANTYIKVIPV